MASCPVATDNNGELEAFPDPLGPKFLWNFPPFIATNRLFQYSIHPEGLRYLKARLPEYDKIEGPHGLSVDEYEAQPMQLRLDWKKGVSDFYLSHYPDFNWNSILPPNLSARQMKSAKRRVLVKLDNMISKIQTPDQGPDIIDQLFHAAKKPTA
ncbi:hypothetical protein M422DRAFT_269249, partial [Sphaerobolus stellatus SS14]